jgi:hypothetical protein
MPTQRRQEFQRGGRGSVLGRDPQESLPESGEMRICSLGARDQNLCAARLKSCFRSNKRFETFSLSITSSADVRPGGEGSCCVRARHAAAR